MTVLASGTPRLAIGRYPMLMKWAAGHASSDVNWQVVIAFLKKSPGQDAAGAGVRVRRPAPV